MNNIKFNDIKNIVISSEELENQIKEPLFLNPVFSHTIWGGSRLRTEYGYQEMGDDIGECWGISAHPNGEGTVKGGCFDGARLSSLWKECPQLFGMQDAENAGDRYPLLIKIIDAKDDLSIQVHPDDEYAGKNENGSLGKMECWYILDCPEGASLVIGHNAQSQEELRDMIENGKWSEFIRELPVKKGDFIQIDPGTVHAIKGGILLLETQQNSDITYRVYDYDRLQNGKPRQLHVQQSIDVITVPAKSSEDSVKSVSDMPINLVNKLYSCKYYSVYHARIQTLESDVALFSSECDYVSFEYDAPFLNISVVDGQGEINDTPVKKGDHLIMPAGVNAIDMSGDMELVMSHI